MLANTKRLLSLIAVAGAGLGVLVLFSRRAEAKPLGEAAAAAAAGFGRKPPVPDENRMGPVISGVHLSEVRRSVAVTPIDGTDGRDGRVWYLRTTDGFRRPAYAVKEADSGIISYLPVFDTTIFAPCKGAPRYEMQRLTYERDGKPVAVSRWSLHVPGLIAEPEDEAGSAAGVEAAAKAEDAAGTEQTSHALEQNSSYAADEQAQNGSDAKAEEPGMVQADKGKADVSAMKAETEAKAKPEAGAAE